MIILKIIGRTAILIALVHLLFNMYNQDNGYMFGVAIWGLAYWFITGLDKIRNIADNADEIEEQKKVIENQRKQISELYRQLEVAQMINNRHSKSGIIRDLRQMLERARTQEQYYRTLYEAAKRQNSFGYSNDAENLRHQLFVMTQERDLLRRTLEAYKTSGRYPREDAPASNPFNKKDIMTMIKLCHPDKHHNDPEANRLTQVLLSMR